MYMYVCVSRGGQGLITTDPFLSYVPPSITSGSLRLNSSSEAVLSDDHAIVLLPSTGNNPSHLFCSPC